jgi:hypothetical protein
MNALLDQFANLLPIFPEAIPATDGAQAQFIKQLVSATTLPLELVPANTGFIDRKTFVTHGEIVRADGTRTPRPRLTENTHSRTFVDLKGTDGGARKGVLRLGRYSTYLAFVIGVELAACLPTYVKLWRNKDDATETLITETAVFNLSGKSSSGKSSAGLAAISLAGSPERAGSFDFSRRGLAELAGDSNDLTFLLDDTEKAEDGPGVFVKTLKSVVQMVPGGRSKIISRGVDQSRFPQLRWTAFGLTSSPQPLQRLARENRWELSPGDMVRFFDMPVPSPRKGGIFDRTEGNPAKRAKRSIRLIAKLQRGYTNHHGHTIPLWALYLMAADRSKRVKQLVDLFVARVDAGGDGWETRFAAKFGVVYAAMQMGTDADLLPWPRNLALRVATKCYRKARAAALSSKERLRQAPTKLLLLMTRPGRVIGPPRKNSPIKITDKTVAIRYEKHGRARLGVLDQALLKIAGSKNAKKALVQMLLDAGVLAGGHGHAGTREERIASLRKGKLTKRTRVWSADASKLNRLVKENG